LGIAGNSRRSDVRQYGIVSATTAMPLLDADRIRAGSPIREAKINFSFDAPTHQPSFPFSGELCKRIWIG
jgi:hypothetical protein